MHALTTILPCSNLDASERFYQRLGFIRRAEDRPVGDGPDLYRILYDAEGLSLHLRQAEGGWLIPGRNPLGLYYVVEDVDHLAGEFVAQIIGGTWAEDKSWGMYEFAIADPDGTLIRVGRPTGSDSAGGTG
jgi:catechol 2,3-dioxygenase-like lactoylglutathione lyase family enzyme